LATQCFEKILEILGFFLKCKFEKKNANVLGKSPNFQNHKTDKFYFYLFIYLFIYVGKTPTQINSIDFVTVGHASKLEVNH
jgi:hypothetical protein